MPTTLNVDWRQVRRWGIDENAIPGDAVVHFKAPTFLEQYRNEAIIAAVVFLLQAGLIAGLLVERRRRRLAEQAVQKQRFELAHASRLAVAGELTGSIAHEINQPLGAILSNADAADLILESGARSARRAARDSRRHPPRRPARQRSDPPAAGAARQARGRAAALRSQRSRARCGVLLRAEARRRRVTLDIRPAPRRRHDGR